MSDGEGTSVDKLLPKATTDKLILEILNQLSPDMSISKETKALLNSCCVEFIQLISFEANHIAESDAKKMISPDHMYRALSSLGFESYVKHMGSIVEEHGKKQAEMKSRTKKKDLSGMSEEELARQQQELFKQASSKFNSCQDSTEPI